MKVLRVLNAIADILRIFGLAFLVPIPFALVYEPWNGAFFGVPDNVFTFLFSILLVIAVWFPINRITQRVRNDDLSEREAYLTVGVGWIALTLFATLPFILSGTIVNPIDAFFESMSGLTTTGSTVMTGALEEVPRSIMLWRGLLQYIGGMGIIVLGVALLARLSHGGIQLLQAEAPGPTVTRIAPKLAQTAKVLWGVYAIFSAALFGILLIVFLGHEMAFGDAVYDAILHTLTGMSTGGFSNHSASIAYYDSWVVEAVLVSAMLISGSSFTLHFHTMHGDWRRTLKDPEWRAFMIGFVGVTLVVTGILWSAGHVVLDALRKSMFSVATVLTGTGYATADFDQWPDGARLILLVLMFTGGMAGSTTGGLKVVRILILLKVVNVAFRKLLHPRAVIPIRLGRHTLKDETVWSVVAFFFTFITLWMIGSLILVITDPALDMVHGASAAVAALANVGPGLGVVGPTQNFGSLLPSSKLLLTFLMWAGRLELFAALLVFSPRSWKN